MLTFRLSVQTQTLSRSIWLRRALQKPWGISSTETLLSAPSSSTSSRWGRPSACSLRSVLRRTPNFAQRQSAGRRRLMFLVRENAWEIPSRFVVAFFFLSSFKTQKRNMRRMWWRGVAFQILTILSRGCICVKSKNHWKYTWSAEALTEDWAPWHRELNGVSQNNTLPRLARLPLPCCPVLHGCCDSSRGF